MFGMLFDDDVTCRYCIASTTYSTRSDLESKPDLRDETGD